MVTVNKYTIDEFNIILRDMVFENINEDVKKKIENLCNHIVIDDKEKDKNNYHRNKKNYNNNNNNNNNNFQWHSMRNFQTTKIVKNDFDFDIKNILNKITDNNYDIQKNKLICIINNISKDENYEKILGNIYNIISDIIKNNIYFSIIYAKLCKDLFEVNKFFFDKVIEDGIKLSDYLLMVVHNKDKDNYNNLCDYNKNNDQKKSILLFFVNVFKNDKENFYILKKTLDIILKNL